MLVNEEENQIQMFVLLLQLGNFNYGQDLSQTQDQPVPFKRKLSKREKKELKKQEKLAKLKVDFPSLHLISLSSSYCWYCGWRTFLDINIDSF